MSRQKPATKEELISWCLRKLGEPLIKINIAYEQAEDCVEQALEYFQRNHYDGSQQLIIPIEITKNDIEKGYIKVDDSILGITRILELNGSYGAQGADAQLTYQWQMLAGAARAMAGCVGCTMCDSGMSNYLSYMQDQNILKWILGGNHIPIQWSRHTDRLYILGNNQNVKEGKIVVVQAVRVLVPDEFPQVWNDPFLKQYTTALIKQQWGNNLRKMRNIPLAGGVTLQGEEILNEANEEIAALQENMQTEWQEPPMPMIG